MREKIPGHQRHQKPKRLCLTVADGRFCRSVGHISRFVPYIEKVGELRSVGVLHYLKNAEIHQLE